MEGGLGLKKRYRSATKSYARKNDSQNANYYLSLAGRKGFTPNEGVVIIALRRRAGECGRRVQASKSESRLGSRYCVVSPEVLLVHDRGESDHTQGRGVT